jgi:hypothetical protein
MLLETAIKLGYGCWYCGGKEGDDLLFSIEFDTPVHERCLRGALARDKHGDEAKIMASELLDDYR